MAALPLLDAAGALAPDVAAALGAVDAAVLGAALLAALLHAARIAGMDTRPATPAMPFRMVRRETESTPVGSVMLEFLLRNCPTKSDRINRIVRTRNPPVKHSQPISRKFLLEFVDFLSVARQSSDQKG